MTQSLQIQTGGTLSPDCLYVSRAEDKRFLAQVLKPKAWVNIYGCRTMGKSSLYNRHLDTLSQCGVKTIIVDVAGQIGRKPQTGLDWTRALGQAMTVDLPIESDLLTEPLASLSADVTAATALRQMLVNGLLKHCQEPVLLVIDEYDYIYELDYCDEILSALRYIQSLQTRSNVLKRLSVCLVGLRPLPQIGKPGAANTSPIAVPIEMLDFPQTPETVASLMSAFPAEDHPDESVLSHLMELSGGQPLVTMELLQAVKEHPCHTPAAMDDLVKELVADSGLGKDLQLFKSMQETLVADKEALIAGQGNAFTALRVYDSLLKGSREAHTAPGAELLLLYGFVRRRKDILEVKGELFRRRFDAAWVERMLSRTASGMHQYRGASKGKGKGRRICVINAGGTIGMVQRGKDVVAPRDTEEFSSYFTALDSIAEEIELINLFPPRDSINIFPEQWVTIAKYIHARRHDAFDGFVVAHGTDTMAYSASAVSFALGPQLRFPVVFTGAQTTPDVAFGDAHVNLYRACEVAKHKIPEVVIHFDKYVFRAVMAQKKDDRRFDGFESPTYPPLAEITGEINVRSELIRPLPQRKKDIKLRAKFETNILPIRQSPGVEPELFESSLPQCNGVIVETMGAGNVASEYPYSFIPLIKHAVYEMGIPVIITSQYPPDPGSHTKYKPAQAPIEAGAIHAGNMTLTAAMVKFRWVLAILHRRRDWLRMAPDKKRQLVEKLMIRTSFVGEF